METHPYNVFCANGLCGKGSIPLTNEQYFSQLSQSYSRWTCPICGGLAYWDDEKFEKWCEEKEGV